MERDGGRRGHSVRPHDQRASARRIPYAEPGNHLGAEPARIHGGAKNRPRGEKNNIYKKHIAALTPKDILPGVREVLSLCREKGIRTAIGSSSKNTKPILEYIGLKDAFDAVVDGNDIRNSKPDPEVFLLAAQRLGLAPAECLVVEDAEAGVEAGLAGGMRVLGVGSAADCARATFRARSLSDPSVPALLAE